MCVRRAGVVSTAMSGSSSSHGKDPKPAAFAYEFVDEIVGGVVPREYIPAVNKGIQEQMQNGVVAGYPLIGVRATLYRRLVSTMWIPSEMAFKIAGSMCHAGKAR